MSDAPDLASLARAWLERNTMRNAIFRNRTEQSVPPEKPGGTPETQGAHEEAPSVPLFHSQGVEQRNTEPETEEVAEHLAEQFAERAAIAEHEGGLPREWAEALARIARRRADAEAKVARETANEELSYKGLPAGEYEYRPGKASEEEYTYTPGS